METKQHNGADGAMRWLLRLVVFTAMAILQAVDLLPMAMLLMPLTTEVLLASTRDRVTPVLVSAAACYSCWISVPEWLRTVCLAWCVLPALMAWLPIGNDAQRRGAVWCGLSAAMCLALLALLGVRYQGHGVQGLVQIATNWVSGLPNAKEWLYQLAASGVLPLKASDAEYATMRVFGSWGMSAAVKQQLLNSLELILTRRLSFALPGSLIIGCGAMGILCAALPDLVRAARTGYSDLPPLQSWYIDSNWNGRLTLLLVPLLLSWLFGGSLLRLFAGLCMGMFELCMGTQGVCLLLYLRKKHEVGVLLTVLTLGLIVILPSAVEWAGIIDQFADPRRLRPVADDDDNDDDIY